MKKFYDEEISQVPDTFGFFYFANHSLWSQLLIYINNHYAYLWQAMDSRSKEEVKQSIQQQKK